MAAPYVPRLALERTLAELSELIGKTPACAVVTGEAGLGKTRLLLVLQERLAGAFECFYLSFPALEAGEFWSGVAAAVGLGVGDDDRGVVLGRARSLHGDGSGLVLLVDDAETLSGDRVADLLDACETPGLSIVLALRGDELAEGVALPDPLRRIDLGPPLSLTEARAYAQARLRHLDPSGGLAAQLTAGMLADLHGSAGGNPGRLDALLDTWMRSSSAASTEDAPVAADPLHRLRAAARERNASGEPPVPVSISRLQRELARPRVRLGLSALFVLLIGGFWYFALQRAGSGASIGVPVEPFPPRSAPLAPSLTPALDPSTPPEAPATPASNAEPASTLAPADEAPVAETPRESVLRLIGAFLERTGLADPA